MTGYKRCWDHGCARHASHRVTTFFNGEEHARTNDYCLDHAAAHLLNAGNVSVEPLCYKAAI